MFINNYEEFKSELINQYEIYCLEYAETKGTPQSIDDYIDRIAEYLKKYMTF